MLAIFFAVITFICWGTGDIFGTISSRKIGAYRTTFWATALGLPFLAVISPLYLHQLSGATFEIIAMCVGLGILVTASFYTFTEALRVGTPSIVGTISGSFVALVVILSIVFLGEHLNYYQAMAIAVIVTGLSMTSLNFSDLKTRRVKFDRSIVLSFVTMAGWAVYFTFIKIPINHIGWFWPDFIAAITGTLMILAFGIRRLTLRSSETLQDLRPALADALIGGGGMLAYNIALQNGSAAIVAPIAGAYPVLFVILAGKIFKDRVTTSQRVGMAITLTGIVVLSAVSS